MKNGTDVGRESYGPRSMAAVPIAQWVVHGSRLFQLFEQLDRASR